MSVLKKVLYSLTAFAVALVVFFGGFWTAKLTADKDLKELEFILSVYKKNYYDIDEEKDLVGLFADELLKDDKFSEYYTKEQFAEIKRSDAGNREGVGVALDKSGRVVTVIGNSPAYRAGVKENGVITGVKAVGASGFIKVNGDEEIGEKFAEFKPDEQFIIEVDYDGKKQEHTIKRSAYLQTYVKYYSFSGEYAFLSDDGKIVEFSRMGDNTRYPLSGSENEKIAVIDYDGFSGNGAGLTGSVGQFEKALEKFGEEGKETLIVDLRDNGGGFVNIMLSVASMLTTERNGEKLVGMVVKESGGNTERYVMPKASGQKYGVKNVIFLANDGSASASEALMGCLLDYDTDSSVRVILEKSVDTAGEAVYKTYGKGVMQTTFTSLTGSALKLTTAKLFFPVSGKCIHGVGLTPALDTRVVAETEDGCFLDALKLYKS